MAKVYILCGKICSGKSTYSQQLRKDKKAVILSVDDITLTLLGQNGGDTLDVYVEKLEQYFFQKSVEIVETGINVVLDWGFWTKTERDFAKQFYGSRGIEYEFHYISINDEEWYRRLEKRNKDVLEKKSDAYYVDEGLAEKFKSIFEIPGKDEIDVWVEQ
ncbi:MAG: ATP-binding protein [Treponema sp.]|nr:ATP-binding protein [Treponema sp.]